MSIKYKILTKSYVFDNIILDEYYTAIEYENGNKKIFRWYKNGSWAFWENSPKEPEDIFKIVNSEENPEYFI